MKAKKKAVFEQPKILILDIENSYVTGGVWGLWGQNLSLDQILDSGKVMCVACKWLGEKSVTYIDCRDSDFLNVIHAFLDAADMIVTFNGRKHDLPLLNREMIKARMGPPSPYKHIDLYETVKKQFKFPSNKMQHILGELELPLKAEHEGFKLWIKCLAGDNAAWESMRKYNIQDVKSTEKLYLRLRPWITSHPNLAMYTLGSTSCPYCGSYHIHNRGYYRSNAGLYRKFQCQKCEGWSRTRYTETDKEDRKKVIVAAT